MTSDLLNGLFEVIGALLVLRNLMCVMRDSGFAGVSILAVAFSLAWAIFGIYFYAAIWQPFSLFGSAALALATLGWLSAMITLGRKP